MSLSETVDAADELAKAVEDFLEEVSEDDGDPWSERPTQDIFNRDHYLQEALAAYRLSRGQAVREWP